MTTDPRWRRSTAVLRSPHYNPKVNETTVVIYQSQTSSDETDATIGFTVRPGPEAGWTSGTLVVTTGGQAWTADGNDNACAQRFTLNAGTLACDLGFSISIERVFDPEAPTTKTAAGWTPSTDNDTTTWTFDPYIRLYRKSYQLHVPPS